MPSWCLQTEPLFFSQSLGHQWNANEPLFSHIASCGSVLWVFLCQKNPAVFRLILDTDSPKPRTDHILGYVAEIDILRACRPPTTPYFLRVSPLQIAQRDT